MDATELAIHRLNTTVFIASDPVEIELTRHTEERTGAGGVRRITRAVAPQIFRMIPQSGEAVNAETDLGSSSHPSFVLLGEHDVDLEENDTFLRDGAEYTVIGPVLPLHTESAYERKAVVMYRGG